MRKFTFSYYASLCLVLSTIFACQKEQRAENVSAALQNESTIALAKGQRGNNAAALRTTNCGEVISAKMGDTYVQDFATITTSNDEQNLYVTVTPNKYPDPNAPTKFYDFKVEELRLTIGNIDHLKSVLGSSPIENFPSNPDYRFIINPSVDSYTATIPLSSINADCFLVHAIAVISKLELNGTISKRYIWPKTGKVPVGSERANYIEYCVQSCPPPPPPPPPTGECGQLRTQTPGGWGAPPNGNNPGMYLHNNFAAAFPAGLTIGSTSGYTVKFSTAQDITNYVPSGGPSAALTKNYTNPGKKDLKNTLVNHVIALTLSVGFDTYDASFGTATMPLGNMVIGSGAFAGWKVSEFLAEAQKVLGGTSTAYTANQVLETATSINENYVDGTMDNGFLKCPKP